MPCSVQRTESASTWPPRCLLTLIINSQTLRLPSVYFSLVSTYTWLQASQRAFQQGCSQVVYEALRQPLLEDLYRHSVEQARLGPVLEQLDDALGALCQATPKELHAGACPST